MGFDSDFDRTKGIGASEAPAVLGLSPWRDATDVWMQKVGLARDEDSPAMEWGRRLEAAVLVKAAEVLGLPALEPQAMTIAHPKAPAFATPDAIVKPGHIVEAKTTTSMEGWGAPGTDEIPEHYLVQVAVQLACCDADRCDVAVLDLARRDFRLYHVLRDRELEQIVLDRLTDWWERYVVPRQAPKETVKLVLARYPKDDGELREATPRDMDLLASLATVKEQQDALKLKREIIEAEVKAALGEAAGLEKYGDTLVTWKASRDSTRVDWEAVARAAGATPELIARHTTTKPGTRRFLPKWKHLTPALPAHEED